MTFRIILERPPAGVDFGIQQGKGSQYQTISKQRSDGNDVTLEFELAALRGPIVQGTPEARFVYVDIGTTAGQMGTCWSRRLKVPVDGSLFEGEDRTWVVRLPGVAKDGGPNCGSAKPFPGWRPE